MEYYSVKDTAQKWGVSVRYVQQRCMQGRIEGAEKINGTWMVPKTAVRPSDRRWKEVKEKELEKKESEHVPFPLMNLHFAPGEALKTIEAIKDRDDRNIAYAEYYFLTGNVKQTIKITGRYLDSEILELRLPACLLYGYANLLLHQKDKVYYAMEIIKESYRDFDKAKTPLQRSLIIFANCAMYTFLHLPRPKELLELHPHVSVMPLGLRQFSGYVQSRFAHLKKLEEVGIGIAETVLAIYDDGAYPVPAIYIHLICAIEYMHTDYTQVAKAHLQRAWEFAKQDGFITPFGETHLWLSGILEAVFKKESPDDFRLMYRMAKEFSHGWREVHNELSGNHLPNDLTPTEYTVAMLVAKGWTTTKIADHLGISKNSVYKYVTAALQSLGIKSRSKLHEIMNP